jgi:hypothetical protein
VGDYEIRPISWVRSSLKERGQAPHQGRPAGVEADVVMEEPSSKCVVWTLCMGPRGGLEALCQLSGYIIFLHRVFDCDRLAFPVLVSARNSRTCEARKEWR